MTQQQRLAAWHKQLELDRQALLQLPAFCRVMSDLLESVTPFSTPFCGEQTHMSAFKMGQQNVGLKIIGQFSEADARFLQLLKEHALKHPTTTKETVHE